MAGSAPAAVISPLADIGHSSGFDILAGIRSAADAFSL
jgi:hypothetical protein